MRTRPAWFLGLTILASMSIAPRFVASFGLRAGEEAPALEQGWANPPAAARLRAYWWWLNGCVTKEAITRDLQQMKAKGFGGALICDAGGAAQDGNDPVPHGPTFFSPAWRELYRHALREADRLGLVMSLNIQSGWNLGGPMVTADDAAKKLVWSETQVTGPAAVARQLPKPKRRNGYYRDLFVVAYPLRAGSGPTEASAAQRQPPVLPRPIQNWQEKAVFKTLHFSAPDTTPLLVELPPRPGEQETQAAQVVDLTTRLDRDGTLRWEVPDGAWRILRFGCTIGDRAAVSTSSDGWKGYAIDVLDAGALERYWDAVVEPLIADAGPLAGTTLKYLHTDSWEVEAVNWTPTLRAEFRQRRGYDLLPYLPVLAGHIVDSRDVSNRFLFDFRRTLGDLAVDHHYRVFRQRAHRYGLRIHPESGGPHAVPIDAQQCLGMNDVPMSEFWARSWRHRVGDTNRFFCKQPASAAHTCGHRYVAAEGFTTIGPHWQETIWDNLKPSFDKALCEGMNLLFWHAFVCSPKELGLPGIQYFAGTHMNPNTTWWSRSGAFLAYVNRCQWMLQQGKFVADVAYYYGNHVPNFAQLKSSDPAHVLPGYDYDVITADTLCSRLAVADGRLVLPDGMSYRVLVLPDHRAISLPVLRKIKTLVDAGAIVIGSRPSSATGLANYPQCDQEVAQLADQLWGPAATGASNMTESSKRRVISDRPAREVLLAMGVAPDFQYVPVAGQPQPISYRPQVPIGPPPADSPRLDYIHRRDGGTDIYFVANRSNRWLAARCTFRADGRAPELWDPVTGQRRWATTYQQRQGRTTLPLQLPPCGSWLVVFRRPGPAQPPTGADVATKLQPIVTLTGPWTVAFDPEWGGPASVPFERLISWTERPESGIRFYSGTATYRTTFDLKRLAGDGHGQGRVLLDLGDLRELAEVRVNGRSAGTVWAPPFRVEITDAVQPTGNRLEVDVTNFWPNRIIGDQGLPVDQRRTRTNIRKLTKETPLMQSGLFGPVRILGKIR